MATFLGTDFSWCVGIEDTFIPQVRPGFRALDEYELTAHYRLWRSDFDLLAQLGVTHVRWGVPWYRVNPAPGKFDWQWIDQALDYLVNVIHVQPIIDLMHYGTPLWLDNAFINSSYPERVAEYAHTFASRYKGMVRFYTPLNEPMVNADLCGRCGEWPPYLVGEDGYVKVLLPVVRGVILTTQALRQADPQAVLVQVEALEWHWTADDRFGEHVREMQAQIYLPLDLVTGRVKHDHPLFPFLHQHGVTDREIEWFRDHAIMPDILGMNFYPVSGGEWVSDDQGFPRLIRGVTCKHMAAELHDAWVRYGVPIMLTETGFLGSIAERMHWMNDSIAVVRQARHEDIPVLGYTWWPLFDMIDWRYRTERRPLRHYLLSSGLWASKFRTLETLRRHPTPLVEHYHQYVTGNR